VITDIEDAARLVIFPDEGHGARKRENVVQQYGQALSFFLKHLKTAP
jgi:dipeptidyl aminopeptidase/acylaminoacyl peptidase